MREKESQIEQSTLTNRKRPIILTERKRSLYSIEESSFPYPSSERIRGNTDIEHRTSALILIVGKYRNGVPSLSSIDE